MLLHQIVGIAFVICAGQSGIAELKSAVLTTSIQSVFVEENSEISITYDKPISVTSISVYQVNSYKSVALLETITTSQLSSTIRVNVATSNALRANAAQFPTGFYYLKVHDFETPVFAVVPKIKAIIRWSGDTESPTAATRYRLSWEYSLPVTSAKCSWTINGKQTQGVSFPCSAGQVYTVNMEKSGEYSFHVAISVAGGGAPREYIRKWVVDHTPPRTYRFGPSPPFVADKTLQNFFYCTDDQPAPSIPTCLSKCTYNYVARQPPGDRGAILFATRSAPALVEFTSLANGKSYEIQACAVDALGNTAPAANCSTYVFTTAQSAPALLLSGARAPTPCGVTVAPTATPRATVSGAVLNYVDYGHECAVLRVWTATDPAGNVAFKSVVYPYLQFKSASEQQVTKLKCDSGRALNQVKVLKPKISTYQCAKAVAYTTTFTDVKTTDVCDDTYVRYFFLQNTCDQRSLIRNELQIGPYDWKPTPQNTTDPLRRKKRSAPAKGAVTTASPNDLPFIVQFKVQFILSTGPSESQYFQDLTNTSAKDYQYYQTQICNYLTSCIHHTNKASSFAKATSIHCHIVQFFNGSLISRTYMGFNPTEVGSSPAESDLEKALNAGSMAFHKAAQSTPNGLPYIGARPGGPFAINPPPVAQMQYETFPTFLFLVLITMIVCVGIALLAALIICCDVICASNNAQQKVAPQPAPPA